MYTDYVTVAQTTSSANFASEVLRLVNSERAKAGLPAYTTARNLTSAANKRSQEITRRFSHTRPNGSSFFTVLRESGVPFRAAGENIAYGQSTPRQVVNTWLNSPGHRRNIMSSRFKKLGVGVATKNGRYYWVQLFTN